MSHTSPMEFVKFDYLLVSEAPTGYKQWYFYATKGGKSPDGMAIARRAPPDIKEGRGSWKAPWARLSSDEAVNWLEQGGNVAIAARADDPLVIYDKDSPLVIDKIETLGTTSRKRIGGHRFGFCDAERSAKKNIPTGYGEVRSSDMYVIAAGSYIPTTKEDLDAEVKAGKITGAEVERSLADPQLGLYTVSQPIAPRTIRFSDLPDVFIAERKRNLEEEERISNLPDKAGAKYKSRSRLFDLTVADVVGRNLKSSVRTGHPDPIHGSSTDANFSMGEHGKIGTCWRCGVSFNAIQLLVILSGYRSCREAGVPHKIGGVSQGHSKITGDAFAIYKAWVEAKKRGIIPEDDPMPSSIFRYFKSNSVPIEAESDYRRAHDAYLARRFI